MHIFFSGIGGAGIGPLALIAKQAGHTVSGSDKQDSQYFSYLKDHGINNIYIGQTTDSIAALHEKNPIDWYVYSSAVLKENPNHPELVFVQSHGVKHGKRDELLNQILQEKSQKLVAIAGTHGKSTTTAMAIWLLQQLQIPVSYLVGAKIGFGESGHLDTDSEYFVYECDEFDRNFLAFNPYMSLITGIAWDHHEIYPTFEDYKDAFRTFMSQSQSTVLWHKEAQLLHIAADDTHMIIKEDDEHMSSIKLKGLVNRQNAWEVIYSIHALTHEPIDKLIVHMNAFPGLSRRMEQIAPNLYSDYAHNPEKIVGAMETALEMAKENEQKVVVVYEPLTNRRMHYTRDQHRDIFSGASSLYWVPSYLAREDPDQAVLSPAELVTSLNQDLQAIARPMELNDDLQQAIRSHLDAGDLVVAMSGGGGNSLDEWLRKQFC